jgi:hypothetical protein
MRDPRVTRVGRARRVLFGHVATLGILAACGRDPVSGGDSRACRQTYEFGNSGCFEVEGQVVNVAGQGLAGIYVGPRYLSMRDYFNTSYATTDTGGRFRLRLMRFGARPTGLQSDTLSVYITAFDARTAGVGVPATSRDSVLAVVTVAPVGTAPVPTMVRITLQ